MSASLGILAANTAYFALSAAGVGAALLASFELFLAVKWVGAGYLVWLGLRMLLARKPGAGAEPPGARPDAAVPAALPDRAFARGVLVQGANPKALVFFTALDRRPAPGPDRARRRPLPRRRRRPARRAPEPLARRLPSCFVVQWTRGAGGHS